MKYEYQFDANLKITGEVQKLQHLVRLISFLQALPDQCPECGSPVHFMFRNPKGYDFYGMQCTGDPAHETNFGQKKGTNELFYKEEWSLEYNAQEPVHHPNQSQQSAPSQQQEPEGDPEDILPF